MDLEERSTKLVAISNISPKLGASIGYLSKMKISSEFTFQKNLLNSRMLEKTQICLPKMNRKLTNRYTPGDSSRDQTWSPSWRSPTTFPKGDLTIPKRSQRIARHLSIAVFEIMLIMLLFLGALPSILVKKVPKPNYNLLGELNGRYVCFTQDMCIKNRAFDMNASECKSPKQIDSVSSWWFQPVWKI